jgi:hypothetical protein
MPKKKRKPYIKTKQREDRDNAQTDWEYRLEIYTLKLKGLRSEDIAKEYKVTRQAIDDVWSKIKNIPVEEMEKKLGAKITIHL